MVEDKKPNIRFDLTVNLGQVLSLITMALGFTFWCADIQGTIKTNKITQDIINQETDKKILSIKEDVTKGFDEIKKGLWRIEDKMEAKKR